MIRYPVKLPPVTRLAALAALLAVAAPPARAEDAKPQSPAQSAPAQTTPAQPAPAQPTAAQAAPAAAQGAPSAGDLLFEQPQMRNTAPGQTLTYDYQRRSGISKGPFGPPLNDTIKLSVEAPTQPDATSARTNAPRDPDGRDIRVEMFSGANRFPAGPFEDMPGNPVLPLFLENHLKGLARVLEANPRYLKLAIRKGLRDKSVVTAVKVPFQGREVDGWRVVTKPFEGDPLTERMRGFETLTYTFVTSPAVPGEILSIEARSTAADGGELLEERLSYDPKAG